jgi:hypothetical protein
MLGLPISSLFLWILTLNSILQTIFDAMTFSWIKLCQNNPADLLLALGNQKNYEV